MFRLLRKYFGINTIERKILNRTFLWLIYASILARIIPLRWFSSLLGDFKPARLSADKACPAGGEEINIDSKQLELILVLKKSIRRIKKTLPWKVKCFEEAIAAKKVLEKYKINSILYLGVDKNKEKKLIAHAWLKVEKDVVIGKKGSDKFVVVGFYS